MDFLLVNPIYVWTLVEIAYYGYMRYIVVPRLNVSQNRSHPHHFDHPMNVVHQIYQDSDKYPFKKWLSLAFFGTDPANIGTLNFESLLAWFLYVSKIDDLTLEERLVVRGLIPLVAMERGYMGYLRINGFRPFTDHGISYEFFSHPNATEDPIVFFHGMGVGLWSYYALISELCKTRTVLLISYECILLHSNVSASFRNHTDLCQCISVAMDRFSIPMISVMGHSWGTFLAGWLIKTMPDKISQLVMIDPVSMFVHYPETIYFVCYKPPTTCKEWLFCYLVRHNYNINHTLTRHVAWYNMALGFNEIPEHIHVVISLSEKDELINGSFAMEKTQCVIMDAPHRSAPFRFLWWKSLFHGDATSNKESIQGILTAMK